MVGCGESILSEGRSLRGGGGPQVWCYGFDDDTGALAEVATVLGRITATETEAPNLSVCESVSKRLNCMPLGASLGAHRVFSRCRFRHSGTESLRKSVPKRLDCSTARVMQRGRTLGAHRARAPEGLGATPPRLPPVRCGLYF